MKADETLRMERLAHRIGTILRNGRDRMIQCKQSVIMKTIITTTTAFTQKQYPTKQNTLKAICMFAIFLAFEIGLVQ